MPQPIVPRNAGPETEHTLAPSLLQSPGRTSGQDPPERAKAGASQASAAAGEKPDVVEISPYAQARAFAHRAIWEAYQTAGSSGAAPGGLQQELSELAKKHTEWTKETAGEMGAIDSLAAEYTPDKTADRIYRFAVSWYDKWRTDKNLDDSEQTRKQFADYMGSAVDRGIGEARQMLGALPDSVKSGVDDTQAAVHKRLAEFIEKGMTHTKEELAAAQEYGLAFNTTFAEVAGDRKAFYTTLLDRVGPDGNVRLDSSHADDPTGASLNVTG